MSSLINKVKSAMSSDNSTTSHPEGTHGPHTSRTANTADPRIDSDRDHRAAYNTATTTHDGSYTTSDNYGTSGLNRGADGPAPTTDGPHKSNLMNKLDPRVDSDRDHSRNMGANPGGDATTGTSKHTTTTSHTQGTTHGTSHGTAGLSQNTGVYQSENRGLGGPATTTDGPHNSSMMNKADPRVDSDRDYSRNMGANPYGDATTGTGQFSTTHNTRGTTGVTGATGGLQGGNRGFDGPATKTDGPHKSNLMNKADPRVDSDGDYSRNMGANPHGDATTGQQTSTTHNTHGTGFTGTTGTTGHNTHSTHNTGLMGTTGATGGFQGEHNRGFDGPATKTDGPHNSNLMNKADPRVDSDRDYSRNMGANPQGNASTATHTSTGVAGTPGQHGSGFSSTGATGHHGSGISNTHNAGVAGTTGVAGTRGLQGENRGFDGPATKTDGPYNSNMMNKADPRVDSDRDHSRNMGANPHGNATTGTHQTGTHQTGIHQTGTHQTGAHYGNTGLGSGVAPGPAPNTAGPHNSDMMNKVDPRVDSDLDGSKTYGGNKTYNQDNSLAHKDPTDAAQVPPSVLQQHVGPPTMLDENTKHHRGL